MAFRDLWGRRGWTQHLEFLRPGSSGLRPELVVEVSYVEWTPDGLLRHVVYMDERQDKLGTEVRRSPAPHVGEN